MAAEAAWQHDDRGVAHVVEGGVDDLDAAWAGDLATRRADRHEVHARSPAEDRSEGVGLISQHALVGDDGDLSFHVHNPQVARSLAVASPRRAAFSAE